MFKGLCYNGGMRCVWVLFAAGLLFLSCSTLKGGSSTAESKKDLPAYYDFGDVLVPKKLQLDTKSSFVYRTSDMSAGVLVFKGRIDAASLTDFFENNMAKDNWQLVSTFKSPRTLLLFQKEKRWCIININDSSYNTQVEIWVAPTMHSTASGLLKQSPK